MFCDNCYGAIFSISYPLGWALDALVSSTPKPASIESFKFVIKPFHLMYFVTKDYF